jgi:putative NADH-flavin reductase
LVEKVKGDVRNYDDVYSLFSGCSAVISTLGQPRGEKPVFSEATTNIIRALNSLHITRYIAVTGLTLDIPMDKKSFRTKLLSKMIKLSFPAIIADKQKEYEILSGSNLDWTLVRLPFIKLTESFGPVKTSLMDCQGKEISAADLANFLVNQLADERFVRKTPFVSN